MLYHASEAVWSSAREFSAPRLSVPSAKDPFSAAKALQGHQRLRRSITAPALPAHRSITGLIERPTALAVLPGSRFKLEPLRFRVVSVLGSFGKGPRSSLSLEGVDKP